MERVWVFWIDGEMQKVGNQSIINYEHFGAYPAAFMLNFPKHPNFFHFEGILEELWQFQRDAPFFLRHSVLCIHNIIT